MGRATVKIQGNCIRNTSQRAVANATPGSNLVLQNAGPDAIEHSANADGSSGTAVAAGAVSGSITGQRYVRSLGRSSVTWDDTLGRIEGVVI